MGKKLKANSFIEGTLIAYISIIFTKILGALYVIPFYGIIGEVGGAVYSVGYSIYNLFLNASTSGVPTAMSILVSEYNSRQQHKTKEKIYKTGIKAVFAISVFFFLVLFIFADKVGMLFAKDMSEGYTVGDIAVAVRAVSLCLLFAPFLSVKRGYLQGHKFIAVSSYSQIVEQVVRIFVVLGGSYMAVVLLKQSQTVGVAIALSGAAVGAAFALLYLNVKVRNNRKVFEEDGSTQQCSLSVKEILKKILVFSIPVVIVSTSTNLYEIIDIKLILIGLDRIGYSDADTQVIASIFATWGPKICMLISALSMGLTTSIVPNLVSSFINKDYKEVNRKFNNAVSTILVIALPLAVGISMLSTPIYTMFYGGNKYGFIILQYITFISVLNSIKVVTAMALQSMGKSKLVIGSTILGVIINALFDLPFIYLFNLLKLPPYLGAAAATALGVSVNIIIVFVALRKGLNFRYGNILKIFNKSILSNLVLIAVVMLLKYVYPISNDRNIVLVLNLIIYALLGGIAYFFVSYKTGMLYSVFGDKVYKVLDKLKIRRFLGK